MAPKTRKHRYVFSFYAPKAYVLRYTNPKAVFFFGKTPGAFGCCVPPVEPQDLSGLLSQANVQLTPAATFGVIDEAGESGLLRVSRWSGWVTPFFFQRCF